MHGTIRAALACPHSLQQALLQKLMTVSFPLSFCKSDVIDPEGPAAAPVPQDASCTAPAASLPVGAGSCHS